LIRRPEPSARCLRRTQNDRFLPRAAYEPGGIT